MQFLCDTRNSQIPMLPLFCSLCFVQVVLHCTPLIFTSLRRF